MKDGGKGGALLAFLGKPKGASEDSEEPDMGDEGGTESAKMTAAEDAMAAFKSGDATALSDALSRHYDACAGMPAMGDDEAMPDEETDEEY